MAIAESAVAHLPRPEMDVGLLVFICLLFWFLSHDLTVQQSRHPTHTDSLPESRQSF